MPPQYKLWLSLYQKIDTENLQCLNEAEEGSGKAVFKPWDERLDRSKVCNILLCTSLGHIHSIFMQFVESDVDEELLFYIP